MSQQEPHVHLIDVSIQFADALALIRRFNKTIEEVDEIYHLHPSFNPGASRYLRSLVFDQLSSEDQYKITRTFNKIITLYKEWSDMREKLTVLVETEPGRSLAIELGLAKMSFGRATVILMLP